MVKIPCNKKGFKTQRHAEDAKDKINNNPSKGQVKEIKGTYKCQKCRLWHLTSMDETLAKTIESARKVRETVVNPSEDFVKSRIEYLSTAYRNNTKFNSKLKKNR